MKSAPEVNFNRRLALLVLTSFLIFATSLVFRLGLGATPYETMDSAGRTMGFNDILSAEHYSIAFRNFSPAQLFNADHTYDWILFVAHVIGATLLFRARTSSTRLTRWFFASQAIAFPIGIPSMFVAPLMILSCLSGQTDREGFVDLPFVLIVSQGIWIATSLAITFLLRGPGLGFRNLWQALRAAWSAGSQRFVEVVR